MNQLRIAELVSSGRRKVNQGRRRGGNSSCVSNNRELGLPRGLGYMVKPNQDEILDVDRIEGIEGCRLFTGGAKLDLPLLESHSLRQSRATL